MIEIPAYPLRDGWDIMLTRIVAAKNGTLTARGTLRKEERPELYALLNFDEPAPWVQAAAEKSGLPAVEIETGVLALVPAAEQQADAGVQSAKLAELTRDLPLCHDADDRAYALCENDGQRVLEIDSRPFRRYLTHLAWRADGSMPGTASVETCVQSLCGRARYDAPERAVHVRTAALDGNFYLDLGDGTVVCATPVEWYEMPAGEAPVLFQQVGGSAALPHPVHGGSVDELRELLNLPNDDAWVLVDAWMLGTLSPSGPYPILALRGEHGSGKTSIARIVRSVVDPNRSPVRSNPRTVDDLFVSAVNSHVVALDNLSTLPQAVSDGLCQLSSGGALAKRAHYTNADEVRLQVQQPVIVTSIADVLRSADVRDRAIDIELPPLEEIRTEAELAECFERVHARVLGALLDAVSAALRNLSKTSTAGLLRMADFQLFVRADPALPFDAETFDAAYARNRAAANEAALEASPIVAPLRRLLERDAFEGTMSQLLDKLAALAGHERPPQGWPGSAQSLQSALLKLAPLLRRNAGIECKKLHRGEHGRVYLLKKRNLKAGVSSVSSVKKGETTPSLPDTSPDTSEPVTDGVGLVSADFWPAHTENDTADTIDTSLQSSFSDACPKCGGKLDTSTLGVRSCPDCLYTPWPSERAASAS